MSDAGTPTSTSLRTCKAITSASRGFSRLSPSGSSCSWKTASADRVDLVILNGLVLDGEGGDPVRADVLVDFRGLKTGTVIRMVNTAPDAPF